METKKEHSRRATLALLVALASAPLGPGWARATERPLLPGVGADDRRAPVSINEAPWRSIVRIQTNLGGRCTGVVVAPTRVLTAAHCLLNPRTRRLFPASSLHALFGYDRGAYARHLSVAAITTDKNRNPLAVPPDVATDWAILTLAEAAPPSAPPLGLSTLLPPAGTPVTLGGYNQDRAQILMADQECRTLGVAGGMILHDCDATRGTSGGPLLVREGGGWRVVGLGVAAGPAGGQARNYAIPVASFAALVPQNGGDERR